MKTQFYVGQQVVWNGALGRVSKIEPDYVEYPIRVEFGPFIKGGGVIEVGFLYDGRVFDFHTIPALAPLHSGANEKQKQEGQE